MDLKEEIEQRADVFNKELDCFLKRRNPENLYDALRHLPMAGGKRLRPVLSMLACEAVSGNHQQVMPFALAVEIIHNFTLVHDDIMDKSSLRRGMTTVHIEYGEPTAIIAGDLLFAKAFEALGQYPEKIQSFRRLYTHLTQSVVEVCEGQQLDMNFEKRFIVRESEYLAMIKMKTSALFRISCEGGVLIGGADERVQKALREYGTSLGLAFQIRDDYLDMSSDSETLGKDIGNDIRNGKKTIIAVHSLTHAKDDDRKVLTDIFGKATATADDVDKVYNVFDHVGSIKYAKKKAEEYSRLAKKSLDVLEDSASKQVLLALADYAVNREK
ncbi:MAG: polyprenyl synthetase family protein [Candidatus Thermoplasmatota archaeon]|nr:polyprenyl synthetase family protein [Candidatus Thermoplasmatota archaeon]